MDKNEIVFWFCLSSVLLFLIIWIVFSVVWIWFVPYVPQSQQDMEMGCGDAAVAASTVSSSAAFIVAVMKI